MGTGQAFRNSFMTKVLERERTVLTTTSSTIEKAGYITNIKFSKEKAEQNSGGRLSGIFRKNIMKHSPQEILK